MACAGLDRGDVAVGPLDEAAGAAGQVVDQLGPAQLQALVVDDVDVADEAGREHAAVAEAVERGGGLGHLVHRLLDGEPAVVAVAGPVREQERGGRRVAGLAGVGAAVAEPEGGGRVQQHLADGVEVAVGVVEDRRVEQLAAAVAEEQLEQQLPLVDAAGGGDGGGAALDARLVDGRVAEHVDPARVHEAR